MKKIETIECPESHTDTYRVDEKLFQKTKKSWELPDEVIGLLGCNKCEDFYELYKA
tara:strand:- start:47 stop:214 length:168 start_codon:yes stop_codon:yes gene_type:complete